MPKHQAANGTKWDLAFGQTGFVSIDGAELEALRSIGVAGKAVAHLCCNNGVELLSIKNMGAGRCVGFDIADLAVEEAVGRAARCGIDVEYERSDVFEIGPGFDGQFDLIYVSAGCLGWMPNLAEFFAVVARLLKPGGVFFAHEIHPFGEMIAWDDDGDGDPLKLIEPYFKTEPYVESGGLDYVGKSNYEAAPQYWFVWTMSDIISGLLGCGMRLTHFREYAADVSASHRRNFEAGQAAEASMPLSYILSGQKS